MISDALKLEIEAYADRMRSSELFERARFGSLTPEAVATYVANLQHLIARTYTHLCLAAERSSELGRPSLVAFFEQRARDEKGHELWAESDMQQLQNVFATTFDTRRSPAISELLDYLRETIRREPILFIGYMMFAEYVTVLLGSEWLTLLEQRCRVPSSALSVVSNHVELDQHHVVENFRELDSIIRDDLYLDPLRATVGVTTGYFDRFCAEICALSANRQTTHAFA